MTEKVLLTVEEAADRLSIGRTKAYELVASGELESVTIGRCRRITPAALIAYVAQLEAVFASRANRALTSGEQQNADCERGLIGMSAASSPMTDRRQRRRQAR